MLLKNMLKQILDLFSKKKFSEMNSMRYFWGHTFFKKSPSIILSTGFLETLKKEVRLLLKMKGHFNWLLNHYIYKFYTL